MKHLILLTIITFLSSVQLVAQSTQKGVTLEYQGKQAKTALGKVQVVASGASAMSADDGTFTLTFQTLKKGQKVNVNRIAKSGYVIFNKDALEQWYITESSETFKVVLCKSQLFDDLVNTYYGVSMQSYSDQLQKAQAEAARLLKENKILRTEYEQRIMEAESNYQRAMDQLQENAILVARIDESELDSLDQRVIDLAKAGQIDAAIEVIKQKNTSALMKQTREKLDAAAKKKQQIEQIEQDGQEELNRLIASRKNDIRILTIRGGKENRTLCRQYWSEIVDADSTNYSNLLDYAAFLEEEFEASEEAKSRYLQARNILQRLEAENPDNYHYTIELSRICFALDDISAGHQWEAEAHDIQDRLMAKYPDDHDLYFSLIKIGKHSEEEYMKALDWYRQDVVKDSEKYNPGLAQILNILGTLCRKKEGKESLAEQYYLESIDLFKQLASIQPEEYSSSLVKSFALLGHLYQKMGDDVQAANSFMEAIRICRQPALGSTSLKTAVFNSLTNFAKQANNPDLANVLIEGRRIVYEMGNSDPEKHARSCSYVVYKMGDCLEEYGKLDEAEKAYTSAIDLRLQNDSSDLPMYLVEAPLKVMLIRKKCQEAEAFAAKYMVDDYSEYSLTPYLVASNIMQGRFAEALSLWGASRFYVCDFQRLLEDISLAGVIASQHKSDYDFFHDLSILYHIGGRSFDSIEDFKQKLLLDAESSNDWEENGSSQKHCRLLLYMCRRLAASDPDKYNPLLASTLFDLAYSYNELNNKEEAEKFYSESLAIRRQLAAANPDAYNPSLANTLNNLGVLHREQENYVQAESEHKEALEIRRQLVKTNPDSYNPEVARSLRNLRDVYVRTNNYPAAEAIYMELIELYRSMGEKAGTIVGTQGSLSFFQLFNQKFTEAEQVAREAIALDPSQTWIKTNLVSAMLLQGRYAEAEALAREIKDVVSNGTTCKQALLDDLDAFEQYGAIPAARKADVERLRAVLMNNE